jgi:acyl carrier protein
MGDVFEIVAQTISEECNIPRDSITLDSNVAEDFGLDSLSFIDVCYALDVKLNIKLPFEDWVNAVNSGKVPPQDIFKVRGIVAEIDKLIAAKTQVVNNGERTSG